MYIICLIQGSIIIRAQHHREHKATDAKKFVGELQFLQQEHNSHYQVIYKYEATVSLISIKIDINV